MKRVSIFLTTLAVVLYIGALPALAQHGHGGGGGLGSPGGIGSQPGSMGGDHGGWGRQGGATPDTGKAGRDTNRSGEAGNQSVSAKLSENQKLSSKLAGELPPNTNLQQAAQGFKNLGQFVAAVHVSHNLGIPFDQLKAKMTGSNPVSLGKAIHELDPNADAKAEAKKAGKQAQQDLQDEQAAS